MVANASTVFVSVHPLSQEAHVKNVSLTSTHRVLFHCTTVTALCDCYLLPLVCVFLDIVIPGLPNICRFTVCLNNGFCVEDTIRNTSYCNCPDGYEGTHCESLTCKSYGLHYLWIATFPLAESTHALHYLSEEFLYCTV